MANEFPGIWEKVETPVHDNITKPLVGSIISTAIIALRPLWTSL
jgi:hypothetical protein